jgi:outer membrane protein TolC
MWRLSGTLLLGLTATAMAGPPAPGPLTIEKAIELALTRNERAAIADLGVEQAEAAVSRARAAFLPVLSASGNGNLRPLDDPRTVAQGSLTLSQPIIAAPAFPLLDQARHALAAQRAQATDDKRQLAFDAARAFFAVLLDQRVVEAAKRKLETANADVADTEAQFRAQLVSSNDVTRARIGLASSERELEADRGDLDAAFVQLAFVINAPVTDGLAEPAAVLAAGKVPVPPIESLVTEGFAQRPDLAARRAAAHAAHDFAREPRMRYFPTLSFVGQLTGTTNAPGASRALDGLIGLAASWSLFDAGVRSADARSRDAAARIADLGADALVRSIEADVRAAAAQLASAQQALVAAGEAADASRKNAEETAILYRQGLAKAIELVDANDQRFVAEVNQAEAEYAVATAWLALRQATGHGPTGDSP